MSQREFDKLLSSLPSLTPEQLAALRRQLDQLDEFDHPRAKAKQPVAPSKPGKGASVTVFDLLERDGLIGCIKGKPGSPTDLATNPKHMEGFGGG